LKKTKVPFACINIAQLLGFKKIIRHKKQRLLVFWFFLKIMDWNKKAVNGTLYINWFGQIFACSFVGLWKNLFYKVPPENQKKSFKWTTLRYMLYFLLEHSHFVEFIHPEMFWWLSGLKHYTWKILPRCIIGFNLRTGKYFFIHFPKALGLR
jgi:hypothetical protein